MRYDHLRQAGSVYCLGSCFHLSELNVPTSRFMKAWTTKRMFTHDQQVSKKKQCITTKHQRVALHADTKKRSSDFTNYTTMPTTQNGKRRNSFWSTGEMCTLHTYFRLPSRGVSLPHELSGVLQGDPMTSFWTPTWSTAWLWLGRWLAQETKWLIHLYPLPRSNSFQRRLHWRYRGFGRAWALHMQEGGTFRCSFCLEPACPFKIEGSLWCFVNPMLNHFLPNLNILFLLCCFDK